MNIGGTIRQYRKEKEMTQEQLAELLGVTASAVNKWERGNACPDIALLAPIARALGISLDTLLAYHEKLTREEVNDLMTVLAEKLDGESYQEVFEWVRNKIRTFPNSEELMVQAAVTLMGYCIVREIPEAKQYEPQLLAWIERGLQSEDEHLRTQAAQILYSFYLTREAYEKAEEYLQYFSEQNPEKQVHQAVLYSRTGRTAEAYRVYEEQLFEVHNRASMILNCIFALDLQERNWERAHYMADKIEQFEQVFEMGRYYEKVNRFQLAAETKDREACLTLAKELLAGVEDIGGYVRSPLYSHRSFDFRKAPEAYGQELRASLLRCMKEDESFDFMKEEAQWKELIKNME